MRYYRKKRAVVYVSPPAEEQDFLERLRFAAAQKICCWEEHIAGSRLRYITIDSSIKLRFADHENTSMIRSRPDFNFVNRLPTEDEFLEIESRLSYSKLCKKTAFAMHVGLTVPKLKKLLTPECYQTKCTDIREPLKELVVVSSAFEKLEYYGVHSRIPVRQESDSVESGVMNFNV